MSASIGHLTDPSCLPVGRLWRYRVGASGRVEAHQLNTLPLEWPTIDPRLSTAGHRHVYGAAATDSTTGIAFTAVARYDTETGEADTHDHGPGRLVGEPLFVPRDRDEINDEGWLIVYANDIAAGTTDIVIFNARAVADGPVCTLPVPGSLGYSFHGQWTQARP